MDDRRALIDEVIEAQRTVLLALHRDIAPAWFDLDLKISELKALFVLAREGPMAIGELGETLRLGRPAASLLVDSLVRCGLVERAEDAADRRRTLTQPTARARELVTELCATQRERYAAWLERLDEDDLTALAGALKHLVAIALATQRAA